MVGKNLALSVERAHDTILELDALRRGDRVIVLWHDACRVTNDPDVRPEYYSTPKETQGTVYDCVPDPDFPTVFYLIISGETTNGKPDYYDAIPIAWIAKIEKLEITAKHPKKAVKHAPTVTVERRIIYERGKLRVDSGGIDRLPKKWLSSPTEATKFDENIVKEIES